MGDAMKNERITRLRLYYSVPALGRRLEPTPNNLYHTQPLDHWRDVPREWSVVRRNIFHFIQEPVKKGFYFRGLVTRIEYQGEHATK
jgi:hypothetical protein